MPELPEVETIRRQLAVRLTGRVLSRVEVLDELLTAPEAPAALEAALAGRRIEGVGRRGKYLIVALEGGEALALHLRMTGQLCWSPAPPDPEPAYLRARFHLDDGSMLAFCDLRRFGRAWMVPEAGDGAAYWARRLGREPLGRGFTARRLEGLLAGRRAPIKSALLNQKLLAGIGNIYADEALFAARIHPLRPAGSLSPEEVRRLHRGIRMTLRAALDSGGSSIDRYRDGLGRQGSMQDLLRVHTRAGEPCPRCGTEIVKIRVGRRGTYLCPNDQRLDPC